MLPLPSNYPSIVANTRGDVVMGFSGSSSNQFISGYFTMRAANDAPGTMRSPVRFVKAGENVYHNNPFAQGFGDYSATTLDPNDRLTIWTIQAYASTNNPGTNCVDSDGKNWGTWIGAVSPY